MTKLAIVLLGEWLEFSGGSRPRTNLLRFEDSGSGTVTFELQYVFDWEEYDVKYLCFDIPAFAFYGSLDELESHTSSVIEVNDDKSSLVLELRLTSGCLEFRMEGQNAKSPYYRLTYRQPEYREILLPMNSLRKRATS